MTPNGMRRALRNVASKTATRAKYFSIRTERRLRAFNFESEMLRLARESHPGRAESDNPVVSVTIPTFNRSDLLLSRAVESILNQTYIHWELVIVGDHCDDDTRSRLAALNDGRIRFINIAERPEYPTDPHRRWQVAGSVPINRALFEARGEWIAYMDDDDVALPHRLERSLEIAYRTKTEFVYGKVEFETRPGIWKTSGKAEFPSGRMPFKQPHAPHSACLYRSYLRFFLYDSQSWKGGISTDRHWVYRLGRAGVTTSFLPEILTRVPLRPGRERPGSPRAYAATN